MQSRQEGVKQEERTFVESVLKQATKPLPVFGLEALPQTLFSSVPHTISQQASQLNHLAQTSFSKMEEIEPVNHHRSQREISHQIQNDEVRLSKPKNKLKKLSKMFYQLISSQKSIRKEELKQMFIDKYETEYGPLSELARKNINRRYYDIKRALVKNSFIQITNGQVSVVENKCRKDQEELATLRQKITEQEKRNSLKEARLNALKIIKIAKRRLINRNKNKHSHKDKDTILQMPLFVYLQGDQEPTPYELLKKNQVAIISGKQENYRDEGDLLSLMHEELKEVSGSVRHQIQ